MNRDPLLEQRAASLYSDALPYHNFEHALKCVRAAEAIVAHCQEENVRIDPKVVYFALLFHDAGYHENHLAKGCPTKEHYSARLATEALAAHGVAPRTVQKVADAILATRKEAIFKTTEQKAVRAADLASLAADYEEFYRNTELLKSEHELFTGQSLSWAEWVARATEVISFFLKQDIRLTSYYQDGNGQSVFHRRVRANLERLRAEKVAGV